MADVLAELFGNTPLSKLLEGLESDIDDLLWALEAPLGEAAYQRIVAAQRPARELAQTMRSRKSDAPLCDAFRDAVLASTKLYALLTPAAKARVGGHGVPDVSPTTHDRDAPPSYDDHFTHAQSPPQSPPTPAPAPIPVRTQPPPQPPRHVPPPARVASPPITRVRSPPPPPVRVQSPPPIARVISSPPPVRTVDIYIPEITSAAQLNEEVGAVKRPGGKPLVVLFINPTSQTTATYLPQFARLVPEFKAAKFMHLSVKRPGMEDVMETLSVALLPTALTFCPDGFYRTTGTDIDALRSDITKAIKDSIVLAVVNQWPRAPLDWGRVEALTFWRKLPNTVNDIVTVASVDHIVRVHLLHTLPHVEDRDANACRALKDANVMKHFCGHVFIEGEVMFSCYDCGVNGEFADYCEKCWTNVSHNGHTAIKRTAPRTGFVCDCGRLSKTGSGDVLGEHCSLHRDQSGTDALATLLALSLMLNAR